MATQPANSRVRIDKPRSNEMKVFVRAGGPQTLSLGVMALIWNAVMAGVTAFFLFGSTEMPLLLVAVPFLTLFLAAGWYLAGAWVSLRFTKSEVTISQRDAAVRHTFFGFKRTETASCDDDTSARLVESYGKNGKPVFTVRIDGVDRSLRFGTALSREDKDWIVATINEFLGAPIEPPVQSSTKESELPFERLSPDDLPSGSPVVVSLPREDEMLIETPFAPHHRLVVGLIGVLVLVMLFWIGIASWRLFEFTGWLNQILGWALAVCAAAPALAIVVILAGRTTVTINAREFSSRVGIGPIGYRVRRPIQMAERIVLKGTTEDPSRGSLATTVVQIGSSKMLAAWGLVPTCEEVAGLVRFQFDALEIETTES